MTWTHRILAAASAVSLAACGASYVGHAAEGPPTEARRTEPQRAEAQRAEAQPADGEGVGSVTRAASGQAAAPEQPEQIATSADWSERLIAPALADVDPDRVALERAEPAWDGHYLISPWIQLTAVPPGVSFRRLAVAPLTVEVLAADGRRIALLQTEEWRGVMLPGHVYTAPLDAAVLDGTRWVWWDDQMAAVRAEQLLTTTHLVRIERRVDDANTSWLVRGLTYIEAGDEAIATSR